MDNARIEGRHLVSLTAAALALVKLAQNNPILAQNVFNQESLDELRTAIRESHISLVDLEHRN